MKPPPRIIFHIGAEKTGTTSFQRFCYENRAGLLSRRVLYPTSSLAFAKSTRNHAPLVASYLRGDAPVDYSVAKVWRPRKEMLASLMREIEQARDVASVLVSAEHFSSRFPPHLAHRLFRDFSTYAPTAVIVLRPHLEWLRSLYATTVRSGGRMKYDDFIRGILAPGRFVVAYRALLERWLGSFGAGNLKVLHLPEGDDVALVLTRAGVVPEIGRNATHVYRDNVADNPVAIEFARRVNQLIGTDEHTDTRAYLEHWLTDFARRKTLRSVEQKAPAGPIALECADPGLQRDLEAAIENDVNWLRQTFDVDVRGRAKASRERSLSEAEIDLGAAKALRQLGVVGKGWLQIARMARGAGRTPV